MHPREPPAVVLGSSLTGLLVSRSLSRARSPHVLVGGPPQAETPRLGESLNECSGPSLVRSLGPEVMRFLHKKSHVSLFSGPVATALHVGNPREPLELVHGKVLRGARARIPWGRTLLTHADRVRLDPWVYHLVRGDPACTFVEGRVGRIDVQDDAVTHLHVEGGDVIEAPRYVFDATGPRSVVADAAGVGARAVSTWQHVAWCHRHRDPRNDRGPWWEHGTNLLLLDEERDGVAGVAWVIPIGDTLSVGLSVGSDGPGGAHRDPASLLALLDAAAARRGWDYTTRFPRADAPRELRHRYTVRDRAVGTNWLLAGTSCAQPWFPTSSGVWTSTLAADVAPHLLSGRAEFGWLYQRSMHRLMAFHDLYGRLIEGGGLRSRRDGYAFWAGHLAVIPRRLSDGFRVLNDDGEAHGIRHAALRTGSRWFSRSRRLTLGAWGNVHVRCREHPRLEEQADAIGRGYFDPRTYRLDNYLRGLPWLARLPGH